MMTSSRQTVLRRAMACVASLLLVSSCAAARPPITPVEHVDLSRYMGHWYVIASIPTSFGEDGYNPVEIYRTLPDGTICTAFRFREGGFDGSLEVVHSTADVVSGSGNAEWAVNIFWFFDTQYIVAWLAPDYSRVIVARDDRDYMWMMARQPHISKEQYKAMLARVEAMGYDMSNVQKAPQKWPENKRRPVPPGPSCD